MKKILAAAALVAFVASPAVAQTYMQPAPGSQTRMYVQPQYGTPFDQFERQDMRSWAGHAAVFSVDGKIVGQDPDADVRSGLARNADQELGRGTN